MLGTYYDASVQTNRGSLRHPTHDYTADGRYFVTICTHNRQLSMETPAVSAVVTMAWQELPSHFLGVEVDAFVVMPNHVHGVLVVTRTDPGQARLAPGAGTTIGHVVRSFKAAVTRELRLRDLWDGTPFWQASFHDRVIRNRTDLERIREYIANNPEAWNYDWENPNRVDHPGHRNDWHWLEAPQQP
jgi:REP element-mobilizing transposase RayT